MCRSVMQCKEPLTLHNLKAIRNLKGVGNKIQAEIEQILVSTLELVGSFYGRSIRTMIQERCGNECLVHNKLTRFSETTTTRGCWVIRFLDALDHAWLYDLAFCKFQTCICPPACSAATSEVLAQTQNTDSVEHHAKVLTSSSFGRQNQPSKKACRCGSTEHSRTSSKNCPLNPSKWDIIFDNTYFPFLPSLLFELFLVTGLFCLFDIFVFLAHRIQGKQLRQRSRSLGSASSKPFCSEISYI